MDFSYLLDKYEIIGDNLLKYGFKKSGTSYFLELNSSTYSNFKFEVSLSSNHLEIKCIDKELNEEYIPFNLSGTHSETCVKLKEEITAYLTSIFNTAFASLNLNKLIIDYALTNLDSFIDRPFNKYPNYATFKRKDNNKWFVILMEIPLNRLTKDKSELLVNVLNIKVDPNLIDMLIDNKNYYKAYHMNHKYWISVLINKDLQLEKLFKLIEKSFNLVKNK